MKKAITFLSFISVCIAFVNAQVQTNCGTDLYEPNNSPAEAYWLNAGVTNFALICNKKDVDWFIITVPTNTHNAQILVSDCQRDYDMEVYDKDLQIIGQSYNKLTSNEEVILKSPAAGEYYVKIFGYQYDYDATSTYALRYFITPHLVMINNNASLRTQSDKPSHNVSIFPNPAIDNIKINYTSESEGVLTINIYDHVGRMMNNISELHVEGTNMHTLDVSYLPNGFYMIEIIINDRRQLKKLTINKR